MRLSRHFLRAVLDWHHFGIRSFLCLLEDSCSSKPYVLMPYPAPVVIRQRVAVINVVGVIERDSRFQDVATSSQLCEVSPGLTFIFYCRLSSLDTHLMFYGYSFAVQPRVHLHTQEDGISGASFGARSRCHHTALLLSLKGRRETVLRSTCRARVRGCRGRVL